MLAPPDTDTVGRAVVRTVPAALGLVLAADVATKAWAERVLPEYGPVSLAGSTVRLTHAHKLRRRVRMAVGRALGAFAERGGAARAGRGGASRAARRTVPRTAVLPLALLLGGALANFVDRLADGRVTDFLDVGVGTFQWPVFNLADFFNLAGGAALVVASRRMAAPGACRCCAP